MVAFQLWLHFSFGDISVWWHFSFGDISVLVTFQLGWHFSLMTLLDPSIWTILFIVFFSVFPTFHIFPTFPIFSTFPIFVSLYIFVSSLVFPSWFLSFSWFCLFLGFYLLLYFCLLLSNSWFYLTALQLYHMLTAASVQWLMFLTEVYYSDDKPCFLVFSTSGQLLQ